MNWSLGIMPYGAAWRQQRRAFHQHLNNSALPKYHPIMNEETKNFLQKLKSNPDQIFDALQLYVEHPPSIPFHRLTSQSNGVM